MTTKKEWFGEWFNSPYYHILYKNRDFNEAEKFITALSDHLNITKEAKILDLACGKGRHSIFLNKLGYDVTGVDLSPESIDAAKKFENERLQFAVHDMRKPLNFKFNFVLNLFTSFGYFETNDENQQAINVMSEALHSKGILVIDFMNAHKVITNLVKVETKIEDGVEFNISRKEEGGYIYKNIQFENNGVTESHTEKVQALKEADFSNYLNFAGLKIINTFGDYQLNPFDLNTSNRLILIAQNP